MISRAEADADFELLSLASGNRKFAIELGLVFPPPLQFAFERGIDHEWFTLVDVSRVTEAGTGNRLMRLFRLTDAGLARLAELATSRRQS